MQPTRDLCVSTPQGAMLAHIERHASTATVRLPAPLASAALQMYLSWWRVTAVVVDEPSKAGEVGVALDEHEWCVILTPASSDHLSTYADDALDLFRSPLRAHVTRRGDEVLVYPRHVLTVPLRKGNQVLRALERVKPVELDACGVPLPWVPLPEEPVDGRAPDIGDDVDFSEVETESAASHQGTLADPSDDASDYGDCVAETAAGIGAAEIRAFFAQALEQCGYPPVALVLRRGTENKAGFTTGRVSYGPSYVPRRVAITTCPNSDRAEVWATIVHELAHPMSRTTRHGEAFKRALVELARALWGPEFFQAAEDALSAAYSIVDGWVATGIRAALEGKPPPTPKSCEGDAIAKALSKIQKLRALANSQPGGNEAIAATARANDLTVMYGLSGHRVRSGACYDDTMVDVWVRVHTRTPWMRDAAFAVAGFLNVFALSRTKEGLMHLFGKYQDVVYAEHLLGATIEAITRKCDAHMRAWKAARPQRQRGDTTRERVSFCDSAADAFERKLTQIRSQERAQASHRSEGYEAHAMRLADADKHRAEEFARVAYEQRGMGWASGSSRETTHNAHGAHAGSSISVSRALAAGGRRALEGGS